jgi:hypothetical protein
LRKRRTIFFLTAILVGILLSIGYGWWLRPRLYSQADLSNLRIDYRTDYVLMTAEIYHQEKNLDDARRRLQQLGTESPEFYAQEAVITSSQLGYGQADIQVLADFLKALSPVATTPTIAESQTP